MFINMLTTTRLLAQNPDLPAMRSESQGENLQPELLSNK